jgi:hypothetical protein
MKSFKRSVGDRNQSGRLFILSHPMMVEPTEKSILGQWSMATVPPSRPQPAGTSIGVRAIKIFVWSVVHAEMIVQLGKRCQNVQPN